MLIPVMRLACLISSGGRSSLGVRLRGEEVEYARGSEGRTEFRGPDMGLWT